MRIIYALPPAGRCGGIRVVAEHVTRLTFRGHDAEVWMTGGSFDWFTWPVTCRRFSSTEALVSELTRTSAIKVATASGTAPWVAEATKNGDRGYYLIQDEDEHTYEGTDRGASYSLPLAQIFEGRYVQQHIQGKYGTRGFNVGIGIEPKMFRPLGEPRDRNRVMAFYRKQHTPSYPDLKGAKLLDDTLTILPILRDGASAITVGDSTGPKNLNMPHRHDKGISDVSLARLYNSSGVFLSTSQHEGFGLPMLEAMACGTPVVCTPADGNSEFCSNGSAVMTKSHDPAELATALRQVLDNDGYWTNLSESGLEVAKRYDWDKVIDRLEDVYGGAFRL